MKKDININNIKVIQAPLAGISDCVYRGLVRKYGAKCLLTTEMLSSEALNTMPKNKEITILKFLENEYPLAFQLVGHKPHIMAKAAKMLEKYASIIDLNFGCPVNKVVKGLDGSAMMKTPQLAVDIVKAIKDVINVPLSAKFRLGWSKDEENFIEFALLLQEAGVDFVTLHARTRSVMYGESADWGKIAQLKKEIKIPLFANGDIKTLDDAIKCLEITGADGVSIGRSIMGDFTLPYRIEKYLENKEIIKEPDLKTKIDMLNEHITREIELRGEINAVKFMRKFYPFYISKVKNASKLRQVLVKLENYDDIKSELDRAKSGEYNDFLCQNETM